jgi:hypothetical protein
VEIPDPLPYDELSVEARHAFDDFSFFSSTVLFSFSLFTRHPRAQR